MQEKNELIKEWLIKAEHDLGTAEITFLHLPNYKDTISFHCQQAVEKYLKCYLAFLDIPFPKTHSLVLLLDLLNEKDKMTEEFYEMAEQLQAFAIEVRYPSGRYIPKDFDIQKSIRAAKIFRETILSKINMLHFKENEK